jgi:3-deoxy-manno-octulosonate cytidylyltransferase (CMP-KDO synthetase)
MKIIGIIPSRYASTRFPGKPLADINGLSMIQRVYAQASMSRLLDKLVVATDDERIADNVKGFGGNVIMTSAAHQSGTDRCAEVIRIEQDFDVAINIQGDEPYINPEQINLVADCFRYEETQIATLVKKIKSEEELFNENIPKVVLKENKDALYFSRLPVPYCRGLKENEWLSHTAYYKHIGIYGYKKEVLLKIARIPQSPAELAESLEQLRWLQAGFSIKTELTDFESIAIDTPEDLKKIKKLSGDF